MPQPRIWMQNCGFFVILEDLQVTLLEIAFHYKVFNRDYLLSIVDASHVEEHPCSIMICVEPNVSINIGHDLGQWNVQTAIIIACNFKEAVGGLTTLICNLYVVPPVRKGDNPCVLLH